ncbi:MAG TPA: glycyl-radical enzyme activating protein [Bacillota bacterium]|nr:glycyl-radical enzyme activating protein [Bacillota bacterium]HPF42496.1 glycyl-radical enzyme activating protein [Bacillota bacterium]HPJ85855.1 glycyl-radical enzyme activating protein [Bacillota bacterium]
MRIINIQRMSTEDGPGLRTTVFFKGCPLSCKWCHNPESLSYKIGKEWIAQYCMFCGTCVAKCPENALTITNNEVRIDSEKCKMCLECVENCPTGAMKSLGKDIGIEELFRELIKDKAYFRATGGVTFSGGECLLQTDELVELAKMLKKENISIAIDTSGAINYHLIEKILPYTDIFLYDIKLIDKAKHKELCGKDNQEILSNLIALSKAKADIWLRTPIIPRATATNDNIRAIAGFLRNNHIGFSRWELCSFNNLCKSKYERMSIDWEYKDDRLMTNEEMEELLASARQEYGNPEATILATGSRKTEE